MYLCANLVKIKLRKKGGLSCHMQESSRLG